MMNDLVSRSAIWELVGEDDAITVRPGSKLAGIISRYAKAIDSAPIVDAKPIVHGRWERRKSPAGIVYYTCTVCENCNWLDSFDALKKYYYCPHCGAKMDDDDSSRNEMVME